MASSERKRRILDHLAQSSSGSQFLTSPITSKLPPEQPIAPPTPEPVVAPTPPPAVRISATVSKDERKRRIMSHVNQSSGNFGDFSLSSDSQKKQILEHIRKSIG